MVSVLAVVASPARLPRCDHGAPALSGALWFNGARGDAFHADYGPLGSVAFRFA